jgi:hypothetical protein
MEEQLSELIEYVKQGIELGKEQAPLVAKEIVLRGRILNAVGLALFSPLLIYCLRWVWVHQQNYVKNHDFYKHAPIRLFVTWVIALASAGISMECILGGVTAWVSPRLYVLEQLKGLL